MLRSVYYSSIEISEKQNYLSDFGKFLNFKRNLCFFDHGTDENNDKENYFIIVKFRKFGKWNFFFSFLGFSENRKLEFVRKLMEGEFGEFFLEEIGEKPGNLFQL